MPLAPIAEPITVTAVDGVVLLDGGPGCSVTLTPDAALATCDALMDGAAQAMGQAKQADSGKPRM